MVSDPRAWLDAMFDNAADAVNTYPEDGTAFTDVSAKLYVTIAEHLPAMAAALTAVLDLLDRAEKAANDSPARMFGGAPFPAVLDADAIRTAIAENLTKEDHHG